MDRVSDGAPAGRSDSLNLPMDLLTPDTVRIEVCVDSVESALAADAGGADRLELNAGLELGGLTPSLGLVAEVLAATPLPVIAMVRPRAGDFVYSPAERRILLRDAEALLAAGVAGLAFGILTPTGHIDRDSCLAITDLIGSREAVFHRAFDVTPNLEQALEHLVELGICRVLTSGGAETAPQGAARLAGLVRQSAGRIEILPGGGIRASNARPLLDATGCRQIHGTFRPPGAGGTTASGLDAFRMPPAASTSAEEVRAVRKSFS